MNINQKSIILSSLNYALSSVPVSMFRWIGEVTDLKLHDAACYHCDDLDEDVAGQFFCNFCDETYQFEYLPKLESKGLEESHIGRTSSFAYVPQRTDLFCCVDLDDYERVSLEMRRIFVFCDFFMYHYNIDLLSYSSDIKNNHFVNIDALEEELNFYEDDDVPEFLDFSSKSLADDFKYFCKRELRDLNEMYDYLENFKENQVEIFKEYIENRLNNGFFDN